VLRGDKHAKHHVCERSQTAHTIIFAARGGVPACCSIAGAVIEHRPDRIAPQSVERRFELSAAGPPKVGSSRRL
jgi:hypothetical protein